MHTLHGHSCECTHTHTHTTIHTHVNTHTHHIAYTCEHTHTPCTHRVDERIVFMVALFLISFGFFAILPMSNSYPDIVMKGEPKESLSFQYTCTQAFH